MAAHLPIPPQPTNWIQIQLCLPPILPPLNPMLPPLTPSPPTSTWVEMNTKRHPSYIKRRQWNRHRRRGAGVTNLPTRPSMLWRTQITPTNTTTPQYFDTTKTTTAAPTRKGGGGQQHQPIVKCRERKWYQRHRPNASDCNDWIDKWPKKQPAKHHKRSPIKVICPTAATNPASSANYPNKKPPPMERTQQAQLLWPDRKITEGHHWSPPLATNVAAPCHYRTWRWFTH